MFVKKAQPEKEKEKFWGKNLNSPHNVYFVFHFPAI